MQKKGENLLEKIKTPSTALQSPIIYQGIEIKEPDVHLSPEATLALTVEYETLKKSDKVLHK